MKERGLAHPPDRHDPSGDADPLGVAAALHRLQVGKFETISERRMGRFENRWDTGRDRPRSKLGEFLPPYFNLFVADSSSSGSCRHYFDILTALLQTF